MTRISTVVSALACVASVALWSTGAIAQSTSPQPTNRNAPQAQQKETKASKTTSDYVQKAAIGDMFEVQSSQLAAKQADNKDVKEFAQRMIKDHTASTKALKAGIKNANLQVKVPEKLDKAHESKLSDLRKMKGKDFDTAYMREQIAAHKEALQLHQSYAKNGDNPVLKKTAVNTATIVEEHLEHAQKIAKGTPQTSSTGGSR